MTSGTSRSDSRPAVGRRPAATSTRTVSPRAALERTMRPVPNRPRRPRRAARRAKTPCRARLSLRPCSVRLNGCVAYIRVPTRFVSKYTVTALAQRKPSPVLPQDRGVVGLAATRIQGPRGCNWLPPPRRPRAVRIGHALAHERHVAMSPNNRSPPLKGQNERGCTPACARY